MKVALVHDWLIHMRGGEKVLEALAEIYPDATIYTLFYDRKGLSPSLANMKIKSSWLQNVPGIKKFYRWLLPFLPAIIDSLKIEEADLVISSSHCVAKGIKVPAGALHLCYCHTPMRYIWGFESVYFDKMPFFIRPIVKAILARLRVWDLAVNQGVNHFIANSQNVRKRIQDFYKREAEVIYPPLDDFFKPVASQAGQDYYLVVSAFVPYKRVDIPIEAFNALGKPLLIVGSGPLDAQYRKLRQSTAISFLGSVPGPRLRELYSGARAVLFPTEEDFGIVPLEAQSCGAPVIALEKGGALESVKHGHFFKEQTADSLKRAVLEFEHMTFDKAAVSAAVEPFGKEHFKKSIKEFIEQCMRQKTNKSNPELAPKSR